jgi:hypothetical protein
MGVSPVGWPEIDAFVRNSRVTLSPWEIETLEDIDDLYVAEQARQMAASTQKTPKKDESTK